MVKTPLPDLGLQSSSILVGSGGSEHLPQVQGCKEVFWQGKEQKRFLDSLVMALVGITGPQCPPSQRGEALMKSAQPKVWSQKFV